MEFASVRGGEAPMDPHPPEDGDYLTDIFIKDKMLFGRTQRTIAIADARPEDYDCAYLIGGYGPLWDFPHCPALARFSPTCTSTAASSRACATARSRSPT